MGQSIDCQPHFGHQLGRRKASYANHAAQVGEKTAVCLLSDRLLEDPTLRGDSRASIRHSLNLANQHIEQLKSERSQVLLGMIDRERERLAYNDILAWCRTVKEARGELTYQQKRDFLHVMGIMVIAGRDEQGNVACKMEIELPEIRDLIVNPGNSGVFEERFSGYVFGFGGPLTQHISVARLEEAIEVYRARRK